MHSCSACRGSVWSRCNSSRACSCLRAEDCEQGQLAHAPMTIGWRPRTIGDMLDVHALRRGDLDRLAPREKHALLLQMFNRIGEPSKTLQAHQEQIEQRDKALKFKDAK